MLLSPLELPECIMFEVTQPRLWMVEETPHVLAVEIRSMTRSSGNSSVWLLVHSWRHSLFNLVAPVYDDAFIEPWEQYPWVSAVLTRLRFTMQRYVFLRLSNQRFRGCLNELTFSKETSSAIMEHCRFHSSGPDRRTQLFRTRLRRRSIQILKNVRQVSKVWKYQVGKRHLTCLVIVLVYLCPAGLRRAWHRQVPPANQICLNADTEWNAYLWVIVRGSLRKPDFTKLYDSVDQTQNATLRLSGIREERNVQFAT